MLLLNPKKRKIKPKTATDKGDGSSTAAPTAVPTQTAPIQRQPNPRVRKQKQTCGTQPTARQSKLIPRKRKINQTTLNEQVGGSNPVVLLGIVVTVGPVNALKQLVLLFECSLLTVLLGNELLNLVMFGRQFGNGLAGQLLCYLQAIW
nr:hypothetical protein Iba_chr06aCG14360 [Ipomoea batatas]